MEIELDSAAIEELLKTDPTIRQGVHDLAEQIAGKITRPVDVVVDDYVTDRQASSVTIRHPAALFWQARDGILTRAASAVGLEVTER